jgi:vancomycin permeability regulator SanA
MKRKSYHKSSDFCATARNEKQAFGPEIVSQNFYHKRIFIINGEGIDLIVYNIQSLNVPNMTIQKVG